MHQFESEGYVITRIPELAGVYFSNLGFASFFNPIDIATRCLSDNIESKNQQLATSGRRRILLIVNWNPLVDSGAVLFACSRFNFEKFANIDEVCFEAAPERFRLVFDRSIYARVEAEQTTTDDLNNSLFVGLVETRLGDQDPHAFNIVRRLTDDTGSIEWLSRDGLDRLIPIAEAFIEGDDFENALWVIRRLRDNNYPDLRSVLCWPIQKLIVKNKPEYYDELLDILETYAKDDEGVREYVGIPLLELARRRNCINKDGSAFMSDELSARIRNLAFAMLPGATGEVANRLAAVFRHIRDVSNTEALQIVERLSANVRGEELHDVSVLMLYFAIYREQQFKELAPFDSASLREFLNYTLLQGDNSLRSSLAWTIWRNLERDIHIKEALPHLHVLAKGNYERRTFHYLYLIITDQLKKDRDDIGELLLTAVQREVEFLSSGDDRQVWHFAEFFEMLKMARERCAHETFSQIRQLLLTVASKLGISQQYFDDILHIRDQKG